MSRNIKMFLGKFHRRNFDPRRIFYEKMICGLAEKRPKWPYDREKRDFSAISAIMRPISLIRVKMTHRHLTVYNLRIINIGRISRCIKNRKLAILQQFLHRNSAWKNKNPRNDVFWLLNTIIYFPNQFKLVWEVKNCNWEPKNVIAVKSLIFDFWYICWPELKILGA